MSWTTTGADAATMVTGLSALTAVIVWSRNQLDHRNQRRLAQARRLWNGYIDVAGIHTWRLRLVERGADDPPERLIVEVVNDDGTPNTPMAHLLGQVIESDGFVSRTPSPEQYEYLKSLRRQRPRGYPVT